MTYNLYSQNLNSISFVEIEETLTISPTCLVYQTLNIDDALKLIGRGKGYRGFFEAKMEGLVAYFGSKGAKENFQK